MRGSFHLRRSPCKESRCARPREASRAGSRVEPQVGWPWTDPEWVMVVALLLSILLSTVVGSYVGLHLLRLAGRTHELPELAIGVGLVSYAAVAQVTAIVLQILGSDAPTAWRMGLGVVRVLAFFVALLGLSVFTWQAFGPASAWRRRLVFAIAVAGLAGVAVSLENLWVYLHGGELAPPVRRLVMNLCFAATYAWMAVEALRYHGQMRRRMAVGLADATVTDRFLLWGAGAAASAVLVVALFVVMVANDLPPSGSPTASAIVTATGLLNCLVWSLTFMPPESYLRWVRARHARPEEPSDG